jgi:hypothetical protein
METQVHNPLSIAAADLTDLARMGRERALAARQAVAELSPEEAAAVGGAAYSSYMLTEAFPRGVLPYWRMTDYFQRDFASGGF